MSAPTPYSPAFVFDGAPSDADLGAAADTEFAEIARAGQDFVSALTDVRRSDGALRNGIVRESTLGPGVFDELSLASAAEDAAEAATTSVTAATAAAAARDEAQASSSSIGARVATIQARGWSDMGLIIDPPGPPGETRDMGTL